jgi:CubicO group peptidase (beta-lactamase class C family)
MELRNGTPEEAGIRPEATARIKRRAESWAETGGTPALVLLAARKGVIFLHQAFGHLTPEKNAPQLPLDAIFPLASITKPITATAVMILVEDGLVGLNRPVQEYIPEFAGKDREAVMVHHLLTHTAGLNDDDMFALMEKEGETADIPEPENGLDPMVNKFLFFMLKAPLQRPPGQVMNYSDSGYYLAGEIVRRVSGISLEQFASDRIFGPLGMDDSYYVVPKKVQDRVVRRREDAPGADFHTIERMERPSPSSGVYSTALDMARFGQMFLNGGIYGSERVLSPATVVVMTRDHLPGMKAILLGEEFPNAGWGLGWSIALPQKSRVYGESLPTPNYFNHGGYGGVEIWVDPVNEIVGVYFSVALEEDSTGFALQEADLFMNMVTAGIGDGAIVKSALVANEESSGYRPDTDSMTQSETRWKRISRSTTLRSGTSEEAGVVPVRINRIVEQARGWVDSGMHPSLNMVAARHGVVFLNERFGCLGPEKDTAPLTPDALFPLASVTKPITATAVMILVEQGLLGLNRPVQEYIPEYQGEGKDRILIRHLLTHTSGLREEDVMEMAKERGITADSELSDKNWAKLLQSPYDEYLDLLYSTPPSVPPDEKMIYASGNYDILSEIIARVSGSAFPDFVRQRILDPLGMKNTLLPVPGNMQERVVRRPETAALFNMLSAVVKSRPPSGGIGIFATAMDLAIFGQMFLNGGTYGGERILSPASVAAMTRDQVPGLDGFLGDESVGAAEWGLGWSIHKTRKTWGYNELLLSIGSYCHGGSGGTFMWVDPGRDLVAVFFSVYLSYTDAGQPVSATDLFINSLLASINEI